MNGEHHTSPDRQGILIVDRDEPTRDVLGRLLEHEGYRTFGTGTIAESRTMLAWRTPDLIMIDIDLPDGNGLDLVCDIHRRSLVPIIIHTERGSDVDVIVGLNHGADDYIIKSCGSAELLARIQAVLRRSNIVSRPLGNLDVEPEEVAHFADFTLNCSRQVLARDGGRSANLTRTEFNLLMVFLQSPNEPLPRTRILAEIWPEDGDISEHAINTEVCRLRRKLDTGGGSSLIATVRGQGYAFDADVSWGQMLSPPASVTSRKTERGRFGPALRAIAENGL